MSGCRSLVDRFDDLIDIVRDLRKQNDIRTAGDSCMKRQPADAAVVWIRSIASVAMSTALWKPNVISVP